MIEVSEESKKKVLYLKEQNDLLKLCLKFRVCPICSKKLYIKEIVENEKIEHSNILGTKNFIEQPKTLQLIYCKKCDFEKKYVSYEHLLEEVNSAFK